MHTRKSHARLYRLARYSNRRTFRAILSVSHLALITNCRDDRLCIHQLLCFLIVTSTIDIGADVSIKQFLKNRSHL